MNNNYMYSIYPGSNIRVTPSRGGQMQDMYNDNMLSPFVGKSASFYLTFNNSNEWRDTIFKGNIQDTNKDYTTIVDSTTNKPVLLWNKYIDYIILDT